MTCEGGKTTETHYEILLRSRRTRLVSSHLVSAPDLRLALFAALELAEDPSTLVRIAPATVEHPDCGSY
jgi:hypothetical protein